MCVCFFVFVFVCLVLLLPFVWGFVSLSACLFLIVALAVSFFLSLLFLLGFVCLFVLICFLPVHFFFSFFSPFVAELCGLWGLGSKARVWA